MQRTQTNHVSFWQRYALLLSLSPSLSVLKLFRKNPEIRHERTRRRGTDGRKTYRKKGKETKLTSKKTGVKNCQQITALLLGCFSQQHSSRVERACSLESLGTSAIDFFCPRSALGVYGCPGARSTTKQITVPDCRGHQSLLSMVSGTHC